MEWYYKVALLLCLALSVFGLLRSPDPLPAPSPSMTVHQVQECVKKAVQEYSATSALANTNQVSERLESPSSPPKPQRQTIRGDYQYHSSPYETYIEFDGDTFKVGCPCEYGRVITCQKDFTICQDDEGNITYLVNGIRREARGVPPSPVSLQGRAGVPRAYPCY